ncbi:MAG: PKD domain-containing protein, partial [Flavobacteriales bacterium]|nr:PKD domain-containing protein [Flavobacteriales bacterium]
YMGGNGLTEHVDGGTSRFSPKGIIYQAVCAGCGGSDNFPTTDGAWSEVNGATNCNMAVFKYDLEIQSLQAVAQANPEAIGCAPYTVNFSNAGSTGVEHFWDFDDDGATSTEPSPTYTYTEPGDYEVMYVSIDETACNISDTTVLVVQVGEFLNLDPAFTFVSDPCQLNPVVSLTYTGGPEYDSILWDLGNDDTANGGNVEYEYATTGTYEVTLSVVDEFCGVVESVTQTVNVQEASVNAAISADVTSGCAPLTVNFSNAGSVGVNGIWYLGNGEASQEDNPTGEYLVGNTWEVLYIIQEENGDCFDTANVTITTINPMLLNPVFVAAPPLCSDTLLYNFTFTGSEYSTLEFDMGDGEMVNEEEFSYTYENPGFYNVTLTLTDDECDQTESATQLIEVDPSSGVLGEVRWPNVISPNPQDTWNRFFRPFIVTPDGEKLLPEKTEIGGIFDTFELTVYNRWGNIIFESHSTEQFWDGKMNGDDAEEGVYYFIVRHQLACGESELIDEAGHFSLLR